MLMNYWSLLFSRSLPFRRDWAQWMTWQTGLDPDAASCVRGERMWSITDAHISDRGAKVGTCWHLSGMSPVLRQLPGLSTGTCPALPWYCVCTYPVSTPFPTCFHAFPSKLYSFYFLQSFLLNLFFFSLLHLSNFLPFQTVPAFFCWITQLTLVFGVKTTKT